MAYPIIAWQSILEDSDFATSSSQVGFTALNTIDWRPYTYWKGELDTAYVTPVVAPYIGIWWLGQSLDFPEGIPWGSNPVAQKIVSNAQRSQTGQLLGAVRNYLQLRFDLRISYLPDDWIRDNFEPFWQQAGSLLRPFFFAWDYENFEKDAFLASVPEDAVLDTPYTAPNKRDLALTFVGVAETE